MQKAFAQSNSSVYAFYNDAPPVLDYIQGYGHTKGKACLLHNSLLFSSSQTIPKLLYTSPQSKSHIRADVDREHMSVVNLCLSTTLEWCTHSFVHHWVITVRAPRRGTTRRSLSRFLAVAQRSSLPFIPWERLRLSFIRQSQWPDCLLCDLQLWPVPAYRWVTSYQAPQIVPVNTHITQFSVY